MNSCSSSPNSIKPTHGLKHHLHAEASAEVRKLRQSVKHCQAVLLCVLLASHQQCRDQCSSASAVQDSKHARAESSYNLQDCSSTQVMAAMTNLVLGHVKKRMNEVHGFVDDRSRVQRVGLHHSYMSNLKQDQAVLQS